MPKPPSPQTVRTHFAAVADAHSTLVRAAAEGGPLDERTRELILLGAFTVARQEGGFKSHARRALQAGATPDEVRQAAVLCLSNVASVEIVADALLWAGEVIGAAE